MISEDLARTNLSFCGAQYYSCFVGVRDLFDQLIYAIFLVRYKPLPPLFLSVIKITLFLHNADSFDKKKNNHVHIVFAEKEIPTYTRDSQLFPAFSKRFSFNFYYRINCNYEFYNATILSEYSRKINIRSDMSVESTGGNNLQKKRQYSIIYFKWYNRRTGEAFKNKAERVWTCPWQCFRVSAVWGKLALVLVFTCPVLWINFLLGAGIKGPSKSEVCLLLADHSFSFFKSARFTLAHAHERRIQHNWWVFLQEVFFRQYWLNVLSTFNSTLILTWETSLTTFWTVTIAQFSHPFSMQF